MRIATGFNWVWIPFGEILDLTIKAERLGYDSVWIAEDSMVTGRDSVSLLACIAQSTDRLKLGTNILSVSHTRHIHLTASTIAALDEISQGRMIVGVGAGTGWPSYPPDARPLKMMRETIEGIRSLLRENEFIYDGKRIILQNVPPGFLWDLPIQVRENIPIYLAGIGPKMTQLAGEIADGLVLELHVPPSEVPIRLQNLELGASKSGRDPNELDVVCNIHIAASEDGKIGDDVRYGVARWLSREASDECASRAGMDLEVVSAIRSAMADERYSDAVALVSDQMVRTVCVVGNKEDCLEKLLEYQSAGVKRAILMPLGGNPDLSLEFGAEFIRDFD
jgi:5,10-methylenetetrahydromethanopterin reductase